MPPVFIAIGNVIAAAWIGGLASLGVGLAAATALGYGLLAAAAVGLYQYQKRKARDAYNSQLKDRLVMTATAEGPRQRIYGRARVSGEVIFKSVSGPRKEFYTLVVAFAGHEVDAFEQWYINDLPVTLSGPVVQEAPYGVGQRREPRKYSGVGTGSLLELNTLWPLTDAVVTVAGSNGKRIQIPVTIIDSDTVQFTVAAGVAYELDYIALPYDSFLAILPFNGDPYQDLSAIVKNPGYGADNTIVTSADKFSGIACAVVVLSYDPDVFTSGVPTISCVIRGAKVYDPRSGLTAWSDNPALCARDWALYENGGNCDIGEIDDASFIAAANACDVSTSYTVNGVAQTQKLYRLGYVAKLDQSPDAHMGEMVEAMAGKHAWDGGKLRVRAGAYSAPVLTLDESFVAGPISISRGASQADLVNIYRPMIADSAQGYVPVPIPELRITSYITEDGQELPSELTLGGVNFAPQALHVCGVFARDMREGLTVNIECNLKVFPLQLFDVVRLTIARYGWADKTFEVLAKEFTHGGTIRLSLKETSATIYQVAAGFSVDTASNNTALSNPWDIPQVTGVVLDSENYLLLQADGTVLTRLRVGFADIQRQAVKIGGWIDVSYSVAGSGVWQMHTVDGSANEVFVNGLQDGELYLIQVRARSAIHAGEWSALQVHRIIGKTAPPPTPDAFTITTQADGTRVLSGGYVTTGKPIDFAGYLLRYRQGAGPYTWDDMLPFQTDQGFVTSLPLETNLLNAGTWSLALAAVDTSGNRSPELQILGVLPNPRLGDALTFIVLESIGWPGTLTNGVRDTFEGLPIIGAAEQSTWASLTTWDAWTRWTHHPVASWTYQLDDEDLGSVVSTLPVVDLDGVGVFVTEEQHSTDGTTWTAWSAIAGSFLARYVRIRVSITATGPTGVGVTQHTYIRSMRVVYTASVSQEVIEDISPAALTGSYRIGTGDIRLPITGTYATLRVESIVIQSSSAGTWTWQLVDKDTTVGPRVKFFNAGVLADPPLIDAVIRGIRT